jgi:hypothetical protein
MLHSLKSFNNDGYDHLVVAHRSNGVRLNNAYFPFLKVGVLVSSLYSFKVRSLSIEIYCRVLATRHGVLIGNSYKL